MNRVIHFEIHADNPTRAAKFYGDLFGWTFDQFGQMEYWMVGTAPKESKAMGINGGLLKRQGPLPKASEGMAAYVCTIDVENLDDMMAKVVAAGGSIAKSKSAITGMAWLAYCKDTEGNMFGLFQEDKNAK